MCQKYVTKPLGLSVHLKRKLKCFNQWDDKPYLKNRILSIPIKI